MNETLKRVAIDFLDSLDDETVLSLLCEGVACFPADLAQRRAVELQQRCQRGETVREIALSPLGSTRMACDQLEAEAAYFQALQAVTKAEVADEHRHHFLERRRPAAKGHRAGALLRGQPPEKCDQRPAVCLHLPQKRVDFGASTLFHTGLVPGVGFELCRVGFRVTGLRHASAHPDADELAEIVSCHVGEKLAACPCPVASLYDIVPPVRRDGSDTRLHAGSRRRE